MIIRNVLLCALLVSATCAHAQEQASAEVSERIRQVEKSLLLGPFEVEGQKDASLEARMAYYQIKGLSIAVINDYKIEWARGYGWADSAEGRPVTPETIFEPGSISKSINAVGFLKLVEQKKVGLDNNINDYLKTWKFPYDKASKGKIITPRHLLSHTAGLSVHGFPGYYYGDTLPTICQILDGKRPANTAAVRSEFEPGKKYQYSGGGSMISELILTDVTGGSYDSYIEENVFKPLAMTNSFFTQPPPLSKRGQLATGYDRNGREIKGKYPLLLEQAAGGLWTTPSDLCKFIIEIQRSVKGQSNKILSQEMVLKMLTPVADGGRDSACLGFFVPKTKKVKYFSHGAGNQGFRGVYFGSFENGKGAVAFINGEEGYILTEIMGSIARVYSWEEFAGSQVRVSVPVPDSVIARYEGIYKAGEVIASVVKTGEGYRYFTSNKYWKMYFTSDSCFFNRESSSDKCFRRNKKGEYVLERYSGGKKTETAEKIKIVPLTEKMKSYIGKYLFDQPMEVKQIDKDLYFIFEDYKWKMRFFSETEFFMDESPGSVFTFKLKGKKVKGFQQKGEDDGFAKKTE